MPRVPLLNAEKWWECPSCGHQARTVTGKVVTPMHQCPNLAGLDVPLVQVTTNAGIPRNQVRHQIIEREDWIGREVGVRRAGRRAVMAVRTERADGSNDTAVYAPTATARME